MNKSPILITGAERSGSTLIARILDMCDVFSGDCNNMFENKKIIYAHRGLGKRNNEIFPSSGQAYNQNAWDLYVLKYFRNQGLLTQQQWMIKSSLLAQYVPVWHIAFPDAKWLIIRRRTGDIIHSCRMTGYMRLFKTNVNRKLAGGSNTESEAWLWWVHQYEKRFIEMINNGMNHKIIWPDRMVDGDFEQIREMLQWLGLKWNDKIPEVILPLLEKSRRIKHGKSN